MIDLEIPLKKRSKSYRFFEMVPGLLSWGSIALLIVLSLINPLLAGIYVLLVIVTLLIKATGIAVHTFTGSRRIAKAQKVDWHARLGDLVHPSASYDRLQHSHSKELGARQHLENLRLMTNSAEPYPKPEDIFNAVIIATYNESYDVLQPTVESLVNTTYDPKNIILVIAYEERGGKAIEGTVKQLRDEYAHRFKALEIVKHPKDMPNEVVGKGGNITYAGHYLQQWCDAQGISYQNVIVTTLDSDNRPHPTYFDYVTYEYIVHDDRKHLAYQPVSLFLNNIWDVPAPMRVVATGNSFWNIISSMRPHTLRNFASHSQPLDALVEMDFWSTRTIVEDGHQYWRSWFYFGGKYEVIPIYVPIYQDAVLSDTYWKTLKAQFVQLRRWAYGASDVPYVATRVFTRKRNVPFWAGFTRLLRLLDGHVTLACVSILVTFGGWVPLIINAEASRSVAANQLPEVLSVIQRIAMIGLFISVFLAFKMLPPRPARYKRRRTFGMLAQWLLMPVIAICYNAAAAFYSQTRLLIGRYLDKFDVTDKVTVAEIDAKKDAEAKAGS
ncbi:MAG TPA: glycosyltransferase family 2 protein [Candidatus Saccharibacteria bacterium]|nr:glycosyltransferase family 2 protein [Candidatus Saccharibacteria bacterium]HRK94595.1 glycosyltransferase family 2 protein [Candidatus Saccharibacteria bacterium]